jgi:hypothetical protein
MSSDIGEKERERMGWRRSSGGTGTVSGGLLSRVWKVGTGLMCLAGDGI